LVLNWTVHGGGFPPYTDQQGTKHPGSIDSITLYGPGIYSGGWNVPIDKVFYGFFGITGSYTLTWRTDWSISPQNIDWSKPYVLKVTGNCGEQDGVLYANVSRDSCTLPPHPCPPVTQSSPINLSQRVVGFGVTTYEYQTGNVPGYLLSIKNATIDVVNPNGYPVTITSPAAQITISPNQDVSGQSLLMLYGNQNPGFPLDIWASVNQAYGIPTFVPLKMQYQYTPSCP
jgi:hypothetical protein